MSLKKPGFYGQLKTKQKQKTHKKQAASRMVDFLIEGLKVSHRPTKNKRTNKKIMIY